MIFSRRRKYNHSLENIDEIRSMIQKVNEAHAWWWMPTPCLCNSHLVVGVQYSTNRRLVLDIPSVQIRISCYSIKLHTGENILIEAIDKLLQRFQCM